MTIEAIPYYKCNGNENWYGYVQSPELLIYAKKIQKTSMSAVFDADVSKNGDFEAFLPPTLHGSLKRA